jgi:hypothetical protein
VLGNRLLRRIFEPNREKMVGDWRRLHNEELRNLYASPNIVKETKSRRMRWAGHVAGIGEMRSAYNILVGKSEGRNHLAKQGIDRSLVLEWTLGKYGGSLWIRSVWLRLGTSGWPTVMNLRVP